MRYPPHPRHSLTQHTSGEQDYLGIFTRTSSLSPRHKAGQGGGATHHHHTADSRPPALVVSTPQEETPVDWEVIILVYLFNGS